MGEAKTSFICLIETVDVPFGVTQGLVKKQTFAMPPRGPGSGPTQQSDPGSPAPVPPTGPPMSAHLRLGHGRHPAARQNQAQAGRQDSRAKSPRSRPGISSLHGFVVVRAEVGRDDRPKATRHSGGVEKTAKDQKETQDFHFPHLLSRQT